MFLHALTRALAKVYATYKVVLLLSGSYYPITDELTAEIGEICSHYYGTNFSVIACVAVRNFLSCSYLFI